MKKGICSALVLGFGVASLAFAADEAEHELSEWTLGPALFGEKISKGDMKGKVVIIEHWGVNCPPCIALLPELAKLDKRYRDDGLLLIGAESQGHTKDQIAPLVDDNKIEYPITAGARGPISFNGIPRAFVFDVEGQLIFNGNPHEDDFERTIKKALKDVEEENNDSAITSGNLFETRSWTNSEGNSIKAAVRDATDTEVTFVMFGGKVVKYPLAKLSEESRKEIEETLAGDGEEE